MWGSLKLVNLHTREAGMRVKGISLGDVKPHHHHWPMVPPRRRADTIRGFGRGLQWSTVNFCLPSSPSLHPPPTLVVFILGRKLTVKQ